MLKETRIRLALPAKLLMKNASIFGAFLAPPADSRPSTACLETKWESSLSRTARGFRREKRSKRHK